MMEFRRFEVGQTIFLTNEIRYVCVCLREREKVRECVCVCERE